jgi:hypothetical protein
MFITAFTIARNWSLSWARLIKFSASRPSPLRSNLILSSHLILGFPSDSFRRIFLIIVTFKSSYQTSYALLSHFVLRDLMTLVITGRSVLQIMQFSPVSCYFNHLGSKYFPQHSVLNYLLVYALTSVRETELHTIQNYGQNCKVLYFNHFILGQRI